jgi:hypothetical protein
VFWLVLVCSGGVLGRSGMFDDMLSVLASSGMFWRVLGGVLGSVLGGVLGCSGLFYDLLDVLACSGVFWRVLACSVVFWGCSGAFRADL